MQSFNSFPDPSYYNNYDTAVNEIPIEDQNNQLSGIGDEYFTPPQITKRIIFN